MPRAKSEHRSEFDYYETEDVNGNVVRIPMSRSIDQREPVKDDKGNVNEFVNVSGKKLQHSFGWPQETDTMKVGPFGIVRGEQWRDKAEPAPAWGLYPPYVERKRMSNGNYDPVYLLTEDQVLRIVEGDKKSKDPAEREPWIKSWKYGPERLELFEKIAKLQTFDNIGRPQKAPEELMEDRPKVSQAIARLKNKLLADRKEEMAILTGKKR